MHFKLVMEERAVKLKLISMGLLTGLLTSSTVGACLSFRRRGWGSKNLILISSIVFCLTSCSTFEISRRLLVNRLKALDSLNRAEVGNVHYLKFDSLAPPIPYDEYTEQGEADARRLMSLSSGTRKSK